jgi:hypothetical protein
LERYINPANPTSILILPPTTPLTTLHYHYNSSSQQLNKMRFFSIAIPLALSVFVAASPVSIDNNKAVVAREVSPVAWRACHRKAPGA